MTLNGVTPDTLVLTSEGYKEISSLTSRFLVWNGAEFTPATAQKVADLQRVFRVTTSSGAEIECSPGFEFRIQREYYIHSVNERAVSELDTGDRLIKGEFPIIDSGDKEFPYAYTHGYYTGAEKFKRRKKVLGRSAVYGTRRPALEFLILDENKEQKVSLQFPEDMPSDYQIPLEAGYSLETRLEWLAGLFDGGLIKRKVGKQPIWDVYSDNVDFLFRLKLLVQTLGADARVTKNKDLNRAHYTFRISNRSVQNLRMLKIPMKNHTFPEIEYKRRGSEFPKVARVIDDYKKSDLYNITQDKGDTVVMNGILLPNNSEG